MTARPAARPGGTALLTVDDLGALLASLREDGRTLVGPTLRDGALTYAELRGLEALPAGWTERQEAGRYRLARRDDGALFGYAVGPQAFKARFFVPRLRLLRLRRSREGGFAPDAEAPAPPPRLALVGARACDLHALAIQDRVFLEGPFVDPDYAARRSDVFVLAVHCGQAGGTCFCASLGTGPRATRGYDVALTELLDGGRHRFVAEAGSERGAALLARVGAPPASAADQHAAGAVVERTAASMGRRLEPEGLRERLYASLEHPRWDEVAARCLGCTSCTLVCPTCFCSTVEDTTDLGGDTAERWRRWDSCFTAEHSHVHGGSVRSGTRARYRQWLVHKLASWIDQHGTSGCVGCGRCITWCPAGIDLTAEVAALRAPDEREGTR